MDGIATRYGLDGPGIETPWGRDYPHPSRPALGPTQPPIQMVLGLSRGHGVDHNPPPSSAKVKDRLDLHLYSPSGPMWPVLGRILPFFLHSQVRGIFSASCKFVRFAATF
jgi:hypothetical protein